MQSSELLWLSHTSTHCPFTGTSLTCTVLQGPPDTRHQKIPTCQAEQAGEESQALPHWLTAFQVKTSIPVKAETTKEIWMQPQCEQGRTLQQLRCKSLQQSQALAGGGLLSALLYHHNTQPGALHTQDTVTAPYVTHLVPSAPSSPKKKTKNQSGFVSQHKAQPSCAMSGAQGLLQPWLNPKKQLHCRKAELTFLYPKGAAAASEAARKLWADFTWGEQQAGTGWMQSHGLGLGRKTGCNWKGQFIRETSHCREVTTHCKGSRPAEGGASLLQQHRSPSPSPKNPAGATEGRVTWNTAYVLQAA